jgi:hypothetical protein
MVIAEEVQQPDDWLRYLNKSAYCWLIMYIILYGEIYRWVIILMRWECYCGASWVEGIIDIAVLLLLLKFF